MTVFFPYTTAAIKQVEVLSLEQLKALPTQSNKIT